MLFAEIPTEVTLAIIGFLIVLTNRAFSLLQALLQERSADRRAAQVAKTVVEKVEEVKATTEQSSVLAADKVAVKLKEAAVEVKRDLQVAVEVQQKINDRKEEKIDHLAAAVDTVLATVKPVDDGNRSRRATDPK